MVVVDGNRRAQDLEFSLCCVYQTLHMDTKPLKFAYTRLNSLLRAVQVTDVDEYAPLQLVTDFVTLLSTYPSGFMVILEPYNPASVHSALDPVMQLTCMGMWHG